jgi:hypothetical protein
MRDMNGEYYDDVMWTWCGVTLHGQMMMFDITWCQTEIDLGM